MQLRQLQIANDSVQDRLLLRIGTDANEEIRVYFTRRFLREIWPHLSSMLAGHLTATGNLQTANQNGEPSNFDAPFNEDNVCYPLGSTPLLVSEATLEPTGQGKARLTLREGRERSFNLDLNAELLQVLCAMLRASNQQAKWELPLDYAEHTPMPQVNSSKAGLLH